MTFLEKPAGSQEANFTRGLLTVVIPHFNQRSFLPRAVASVLLGETHDLEIIIVDDGSTDGSESILAGLERNPKVRIIRCPKNRGAPTALNIGLAAAQGEYTAFLGADDVAMPMLYSTMIAALDRHPAAALACGEVAIATADGDIRGIRPITPPAFRAGFIDPRTVVDRIADTDNWLCNTSAVYRTRMVREVGGYDPALGSFCDGFVSRVLIFMHGFVFVPGVRGIWQVAAETLSSRSVLDSDESVRLVTLAHNRLASSAPGQLAPDYPETFARRLRFGAARLQFVWNGSGADPAAVARAAGGGERDRRALVSIHRTIGFGGAGRFLALCWLTCRLRPVSLPKLALSLVRMQIALWLSRRGVKAWLAKMNAAGFEAMSVADSKSRHPTSESRVR